ncbi:MAG: hypothetical protein ACXVLQ_09960 [Bacteriovorax sp.]
MSKLRNKKVEKSHLTAEQKEFGKTQIYVLVGMIVIGLAAALYYMQ